HMSSSSPSSNRGSSSGSADSGSHNHSSDSANQASHGRPRAGSESASRGPVSKVIDMFRHRSHSAVSAEDKRKAQILPALNSDTQRNTDPRLVDFSTHGYEPLVDV
ncbi:Uncharacterized protein GBIM_11580, partial [Gryllus bimaculatus]